MNKATIYNVAYAANVSLATVSRTLNNPQKVKPETRDRVLRVIKELGYKPNAFAKGLASKKINNGCGFGTGYVSCFCSRNVEWYRRSIS